MVHRYSNTVVERRYHPHVGRRGRAADARLTSIGLHWKTTTSGIERLKKAGRVLQEGRTPRFLRFLDDLALVPKTNVWLDIGGIQSRTDPKVYVVQTATSAVSRCILMTTDPGDLVLDPTCGSGTTAYVAEQWGRRWMTVDTSRVALALARSRIMGARYPYYTLADSPEGQGEEARLSGSEPKNTRTQGDIRQGFVYQRVPHITLKAIANNTEIDTIWEQRQPAVEAALAALNDTHTHTHTLSLSLSLYGANVSRHSGGAQGPDRGLHRPGRNRRTPEWKPRARERPPRMGGPARGSRRLAGPRALRSCRVLGGAHRAAA